MQSGENDPPPTVSRLPLLSAKARRLSRLHESPSKDVSSSAKLASKSVSTFTVQPEEKPRTRQGKARFSLAGSPNSPLATPPKRKLVDEIVQSERKLNAYGIPLQASKRTRPSKQFISSIGRASMRMSSDGITVCVRKKPADSDIVHIEGTSIAVNESKTRLDGIGKYSEQHRFQFDRVYDEVVGNHQVKLNSSIFE